MSRYLFGILLLAICTAVWADGGFVPRRFTRATAAGASSAAAQKGIMVSEPGSEVLLLQTTYRGPAADFAWIIPVPAAPQEVFAANAEFIDAILRQTSPVQVDHHERNTAIDSGRGGRGYGGGGGSIGGTTPSAPPPVQVLARMAVGKYDAAVLAADRAGGQAGDIVQWLQDNGYEVSDRLTEVIQPYVKQQWVFVALKLQQQTAADKSLLQDVPPIGIRFPQSGGRLVFPLYISRLSAPDHTGIALVTIARSSYRCRELPVVWPDQSTPIHSGETYGDFRRKLCRDPVPALLCEYRVSAPDELKPYREVGGKIVISQKALSMSYRASGGDPVSAGLGGRPTVTRYFAYLQPGEMQDLNLRPFGVASPEGYVLLMERTGPLDAEDYWWRNKSDTLDHFIADCGAYPSKLEDLLTAPTVGQDASGNPVPITNWHGPYLAQGYANPASLSRYRLDPLNISLCDLRGMEGTIRPVSLSDCRNIAKDRDW